MFKKIILVGVLVVLAGVLLVGAVNRTLAKTGTGRAGEAYQMGWGASRATSQEAASAGQSGVTGQGERWAKSGDQANGQGGRWAGEDFGNGRGGQGNRRGAGGQGGRGARP